MAAKRPGAPTRAEKDAARAAYDLLEHAKARGSDDPIPTPPAVVDPTQTREAAELRLANAARAVAGELRRSGESRTQEALARWAGCTAADLQPALTKALADGEVVQVGNRYAAPGSPARGGVPR